MKNKKKVDLHIHSFYSDGTYDVNHILKQAQLNGVDVLSITDHNCLKAYGDIEKPTCMIIPGVELDCVHDDHYYHVLGYGIDLSDQMFAEFVEENEKKLEEVNVKLLEKVMVDHPELSKDDYQHFTYDQKLGGWKLLHYFVHRGLCQTIWDGFGIYADYHHSYTCVDFPSLDEVCAQIHRSKGKTVLAHPGKVISYQTLDEFKNQLNKLIRHNLDGIECYYPSHSEEITKICLECCKQNKLLITCGSDCHGDFEQTQIGEMDIKIEQLNLTGLV